MIKNKSKHSIFFLIFVLVISFGTGCRDSRLVKKPSTRAVSDDIGRTVNVSMPVNRIVSLAPSLTEMTFAAGAGDKLVGITSYCDFPSATASIAKVGDTQTPNIEKIVALQPQIVLISTSSQLESFLSVLDQQNIAVYVMDVRGIDDVATGLRKLGSIFGTEEVSEKAAQEFEIRAKAVSEANSGTKNHRPSVFVQISNEPLITIGKGSFLIDLIAKAGGDSVTKNIGTAYPKLSKETALALNPDVIVLTESDDNLQPNQVFKDSPAVKNGRVYQLNADVLSRPGPRLADALEEISKHLNNPSN